MIKPNGPNELASKIYCEKSDINVAENYIFLNSMAHMNLKICKIFSHY